MRCGDATVRAGDLPVWAVVVVLLTAAKERDRTSAFRVHQVPWAQRLVKALLLPRAATCEHEREGDGATIACGGGGWKMGGWKMDESAGLAQDGEALRSIIVDVDCGVPVTVSGMRDTLAPRHET
jgi:hypothetical protein